MARGTSTLARTPFHSKAKAPREARPSKLAPRQRKAPTIYRSAKLMASANGQACACCGIRDGTIVGAHRNEGKGERLKNPDCWTAYLCLRCHAMLDQGKDLARDARRLMWSAAYVRTLNVWLVSCLVVGESADALDQRRMAVQMVKSAEAFVDGVNALCEWVHAEFMAGRLCVR